MEILVNVTTGEVKSEEFSQERAAEIAARYEDKAPIKEARRVEQKREAAIRALAERMLDEAIADPDAPQAVRDYAAEL